MFLLTKIVDFQDCIGNKNASEQYTTMYFCSTELGMQLEVFVQLVAYN